MTIIGIHVIHDWKTTPFEPPSGVSAVYYIHADNEMGSRAELACKVQNNRASAELIGSNLSGLHNVPVRLFHGLNRLPGPVTSTQETS